MSDFKPEDPFQIYVKMSLEQMKEWQTNHEAKHRRIEGRVWGVLLVAVTAFGTGISSWIKKIF